MSDKKTPLTCNDLMGMFHFPLIFRSFKMAIHPSKLILGLLAVLLVWGGGLALDVVWSNIFGQRVMENEIFMQATVAPEAYEAQRQKWEDQRLQNAAQLLAAAQANRQSLAAFKMAAGSRSPYLSTAIAEELTQYNKKHDQPQSETTAPKSATEIRQAAEKDGDDWGDLLDAAEEQLALELDKANAVLEEAQEAAEKKIEDADLNEEDLDKAEEDLELAVSEAIRAMTTRQMDVDLAITKIRGQKIFQSFFKYESDCFYNALLSLRYGNIAGGLGTYNGYLQQRAGGKPAGAQNPMLSPESKVAPDEHAGFLYYALMALEGVAWLIKEHLIFAIIFLGWTLAVWSWLGGAIYRISAIQFARGETISMKQALGFSCSRFGSFFTSPLVPLIVILAIAAVLMIGGALCSLPLIGWIFKIIQVILLFISLLIGLGLAFMLVGLLVGWPLMFPTVAAEGNDCFGAVSQSFAFIYERPWRRIAYGVIAGVYGMLCYFFVRFFIFLAISGVRLFIKWGAWGGGDPVSTQADWVDVVWPAPQFWNLFDFNFSAAYGFNGFLTLFVGFWVFLFIALLAAFALSYFCSAGTVIYFLLRNKVDAVDLDEVYIEGEEDDLHLPEEEEEDAEETAAAEEAEEETEEKEE